MNLEELQQKIGYTFRNPALLTLAMTHSSYYNEHKRDAQGDNERLEFLGDAVLELVSSDYLYHKFSDMPEGEMTKLRAGKVCEPALALCARNISLEASILLGKGEEQTGGRTRDSIISDAYEALIGAIYLDGGFTSAKDFVLKHVLADMEEESVFCDSKTALQEMAQEYLNDNPVYELLREEGPEHDRIFYAQVLINGTPYGVGQGRTKKAAQQQAASEAMRRLQKTIEEVPEGTR